jgi:enamine deaminase RidA (YjgF/YER057c/UK114 family)
MAKTSGVTYIDPPGAPPAQGLYSHAAKISAGDLYFIAGQLSVGADGQVVGRNDFEAQFRQVFGNLGLILEGLGVSYDHVAKFTTYFVHSQDIEKFMKLRAELFPKIFSTGKFPPNTICVIDRLVKEDFLLEVEAIARAE